MEPVYSLLAALGFAVMAAGLTWIGMSIYADGRLAFLRFRTMENARPTTVGVQANDYKSQVVGVFRKAGLDRFFGAERLSRQLIHSGNRGRDALNAVLFMKIVAPPIAAWLAWQFDAAQYLIEPLSTSYDMIRNGAAVALGIVCFFIPDLIVTINVGERREALRSGLPDAVDLLYICVQAGMSFEAALGRVTSEVERRSTDLADELRLLAAEIAYLTDRRIAYENFRFRCGIEEIDELVLIIQQAERYGTSLGEALRQLSVESRARQMLELERKALQLPAKLAVPITGFLLPGVVAMIFAPMFLGGFGP